MRKIIFSFLCVMCIWQASFAFAADCIATLDSQVCVGESHDSVIAKIDKSYSTGQEVTSGAYGPIVERSYLYNGNKFTLRFERTSQNGPFLLTKIIY